MKAYSELLDMQTRGENVSPNPANDVTIGRKAKGQRIMKKSEGNDSAAFQIAMNDISDNVPRLQEFILQHSEEPSPNLGDMVKQVYELRQRDAAEANDVLGFQGKEEPILFLEQQEADFINENGYPLESFLGDLYAPIDIAYSYMMKNSKPDNFVDPALLTGIINTVGSKVGSADLKRAAQDKPAGILGFLGAGGTAHYNSLRSYFKDPKNAATRQAVINGQITSEAQLPGWTSPITNMSGSFQPVVNNLAGSAFKSFLPYIILFLVLIGIIVFIASRHKHK